MDLGDPPSLLPSPDVGVDEEWLCHYPLADNPLQEALPAEAGCIDRDNDSIFSDRDVPDSESCVDRSPQNDPFEGVRSEETPKVWNRMLSDRNSGKGFDFRKDGLQERLGGAIDHGTDKLDVRTEFMRDYEPIALSERSVNAHLLGEVREALTAHPSWRKGQEVNTVWGFRAARDQLNERAVSTPRHQEIIFLKDKTRISIDLQSGLCATLGVRWELRASFNNFSLTITNDYSLKKIFANCHDPSHLVWRDTGWVPRFLRMLFSCSSPGTEDFCKEWPSKSGSQASVDDVTNCEHRNSDDIPDSEKDDQKMFSIAKEWRSVICVLIRSTFQMISTVGEITLIPLSFPGPLWHIMAIQTRDCFSVGLRSPRHLAESRERVKTTSSLASHRIGFEKEI